MGAKIKDCGETQRDGKPQRMYLFHCPGCGYSHPFHVPMWTWNGSLDAPTFSPSLMVNGSDPRYRCHSFVKEGKIQFLSDCFHKLAGQTVELPDWEA
jgi:hypothetical protein